MSFQADKDYLDKVRSVQGYKKTSFALLGLRKGQKVLDAGCGTGSDAMEVARFVGPTGLVVGIDNNPEIIQIAHEKAKGLDLPLEFRLEDAHQFSFDDGTFDAVRTDRLLQHVEDPFKVMTELCRVTKPGGIVVASEPDWGTLVIDSADYDTTTRIIDRGFRSLIRHPWMGRSLFALFKRCGLMNVQVLAVTDFLIDFTKARQIFRLDDLIQRAGLNNAEGEMWIKSLEQANKEGLFLSSITVYIASGQRAG